MKSIVETTGQFGLRNSNGETVHYDRPSVVTNTQFIDQKIFRKEVRVLAYTLPDKATDEAFNAALIGAKGDVKLAIAAYCAEFGQAPSGEKLNASEIEYESEADKKARDAAAAAQKEIDDAAAAAQKEIDDAAAAAAQKEIDDAAKELTKEEDKEEDKEEEDKEEEDKDQQNG